MAGAAGRMAAVTGLTAAALTLAACSAGSHATTRTKATGDDFGLRPQRVLHAPGCMLAATEFQANGVMWALTGPGSAGLFQLSPATGQVKSSFSVSDFARSVAESPAGVIALALDTGRSGALQLIKRRDQESDPGGAAADAGLSRWRWAGQQHVLRADRAGLRGPGGDRERAGRPGHWHGGGAVRRGLGGARQQAGPPCMPSSGTACST